MSVLVVDPYRHSRQGLDASLNEMGYRVETAGNLAEAIALIDRMPFDIAVIDLDLPRWSAPPGAGGSSPCSVAPSTRRPRSSS